MGDADKALKTPHIDVNKSAEQLRERLLQGEEFDRSKGVRGPIWAGTIENPIRMHGRVPGLPTDEVDKLVGEVGEIKQLLFCRLLLRQATLLPIALKVDSIQDLFSHPDVPISDLRDLCLKLEQPTLQQIRDACADFTRGDAEEADNEETPEDYEEDISEQAPAEARRQRRMDKTSSHKAITSLRTCRHNTRTGRCERQRCRARERHARDVWPIHHGL